MTLPHPTTSYEPHQTHHGPKDIWLKRLQQVSA